METILYSCGSTFGEMSEEEEESTVLKAVCVRANLSCRMDIELTYYSAGYEQICIHCGSEEHLQAKQGYHPQCRDCEKEKPVHKRGAAKK
jgi:hypothetical protein